MKCQKILPTCLLIWTMTAYVSCNNGQNNQPDIKVKSVSDGIELSCGDSHKISSENGEVETPLTLAYKDENTGEYKCLTENDGEFKFDGRAIFVKFRTCDNCVELDLASIIGMAIGNVVATIVIGVAVYLTASQTRIGPVTSHKKSSDRQHLVPNEVSNRAPNDHYQPLSPRGVQKDTYDVLTNRR